MCLLLDSQATCHPFHSDCLDYCGIVRASRFYCHCEGLMIFRELASHSLIGCVVSGVVYKFDSLMREMGIEESVGNVAVGRRREQALPVVVE